MRDDIVVVGGGFAGFWAAIAARRVAKEQLAITIVSRDPLLQMRPRFYESNPESLAVDMRPHLAAVNVQFAEGEAESLDLEDEAVLLASGERRGYRRLLVSTGSELRRPAIPGSASAFSIDCQRDAMAFDRRLHELARGARIPRVAIVGAGFTGIELALELRDRVGAHSDAGVGERMEIHLYDQTPLVGPELGAHPRPHIERALRAARVQLHLGAQIRSLLHDELTLADGQTSRYGAIVLTTGMTASSFTRCIPGAHDELGRVFVDRALRAPAARHIYVAGDAAAALTSDRGPIALQSCQHALQMGRFAGENAARDLLGLTLLSYEQPRYITCLDLGRSGALWTEGWSREVTKLGAEAKALKRRINRVVIYPPPTIASEYLLLLSSTDQDVQRQVRSEYELLISNRA